MSNKRLVELDNCQLIIGADTLSEVQVQQSMCGLRWLPPKKVTHNYIVQGIDKDDGSTVFLCDCGFAFQTLKLATYHLNKNGCNNKPIRYNLTNYMPGISHSFTINQCQILEYIRKNYHPKPIEISNLAFLLKIPPMPATKFFTEYEQIEKNGQYCWLKDNENGEIAERAKSLWEQAKTLPPQKETQMHSRKRRRIIKARNLVTQNSNPDVNEAYCALEEINSDKSDCEGIEPNATTQIPQTITHNEQEDVNKSKPWQKNITSQAHLENSKEKAPNATPSDSSRQATTANSQTECNSCPGTNSTCDKNYACHIAERNLENSDSESVESNFTVPVPHTIGLNVRDDMIMSEDSIINLRSQTEQLKLQTIEAMATLGIIETKDYIKLSQTLKIPFFVVKRHMSWYKQPRTDPQDIPAHIYKQAVQLRRHIQCLKN